VSELELAKESFVIMRAIIKGGGGRDEGGGESEKWKWDSGSLGTRHLKISNCLLNSY